jgi:Glycosyltransferase WbsX
MVVNRKSINESLIAEDEAIKKARVIAFYLPQYHPIPENDEWWGKGFTEWTNTSNAKPLFKEHYQPHLPADLGFYDLRLAETRQAQADLARAYGIHGFCYWHYWFHGKRLLEQPVNAILDSGEPDFPFCLAWANESWSRRWLGEDKEILIEQKYSPEDDKAHAEWLVNCFADPRYIKVGDRPLFSIYRPTSLPDPKSTTQLIREVCKSAGLPDPYLVGINAHSRHIDMRTLGFDSTEDHSPQLGVLQDVFNDDRSLKRLARNLKQGLWSAKLKIYKYADAIDLMESSRPKYPHHPGFFVGWDNTARRGENAIVMTGSTPDIVATHLSRVINNVSNVPLDERIIFLNAWNEWAEGMYLEPNSLHGTRLLEAIRAVIHPN